MNTGLGNSTFSKPRLPTVVPSVRSPTESPTVSPRVKIELTRTLAELGLFAELGVQMQRLHVHRERRDQQVVGLGDRAAGLMLKRFADFELFEILAHRDRSQREYARVFACAAWRRRPES